MIRCRKALDPGSMDRGALFVDRAQRFGDSYTFAYRIRIIIIDIPKRTRSD